LRTSGDVQHVTRSSGELGLSCADSPFYLDFDAGADALAPARSMRIPMPIPNQVMTDLAARIRAAGLSYGGAQIEDGDGGRFRNLGQSERKYATPGMKLDVAQMRGEVLATHARVPSR